MNSSGVVHPPSPHKSDLHVMPSPSDDNGDPFACFGDDNDDDDDESNSEIAGKERDAECGVLAFHDGTERALLTYVENALAAASEQSSCDESVTTTTVIRAMDKFCMERHWMMHIGTDKAAVVQQFLTRCLATTPTTTSTPLQVVELGTYCGYSAIILGQTLQKAGRRDSHIYTVEVNPQFALVASRLIQLAKLDHLISILLLNVVGEESDDEDDDLVNKVLKPKLSGEKKIHFLFLDHDKDHYLADLERLERGNLLCANTHVAADNVIFAQIHDYRNYVYGLAAQGIVETKLVKTQLEYSEPDATNASNRRALQDGMELTVYLKDPGSRT